MKKLVLILMAICLIAGFATAQVKFSTSNVVYAYVNTATGAASFEVSPSVTAVIDKLTIALGGDATLADFSGLTGWNVYATATYNLGFASAYITPKFYKSGAFGVDTAITFNIPHFPVLVEYTAGDVTKPGTITADVTISF